MSFYRSQSNPKERVIGIGKNGNFKASPFVELLQKKSPVEDLLGGKQIILGFNLETLKCVILDAKGNVLPIINALWFAWDAFNPETQIISNIN